LHIVLLGDSIFDNGAYVAGGPDVAAQLRGIAGERTAVTLLAIDGAVVAGVARQIQHIPRGATHLVLSVGGNDALGYLGILERPAASVGEVLDLLAAIRVEFERGYAEVVEQLVATRLPLVLCTIYEGALPDAELRRRALAALPAFNEAILRTALENRLSLIDLRLVCDQPTDYANPIEPSVAGGEKIARVVAEAVGMVKGTPAAVWVGPRRAPPDHSFSRQTA
jgi:hypothetical protein